MLARRRLALTLLLLAAAGLGGCAGCGGSGSRPRIAVPAGHGAPPRLKLPLGSSVLVEPAQQDAPYLKDFLTTFSSLTPENAMKWAETEPQRGHYTFGDADALVSLAERTGKRIRGHELVWDEQLPGWLTSGHWSAKELQHLLADHIRTEVGRYKGKIAEWDVVNEPFDPDGSLTHDLWLKVLGPGYIADAFRLAHQADPHAKLFLNEFAVERPGPKQDALYALVKKLRAQGVPIDGVGFQNHTTVSDFPDTSQLERTFRRFTALGVDVEITEMDVTIPPSQPTTKAVLDRQAQAFADAANACVSVKGCTGMTVWGVTDKYSWKGADERPLLYDARARPKPALAATLGVLKKASG